MSLTLFSKEQCPFCWQVKIALAYFDKDYELKEWKTPDRDMLLQYSPQGSSPILLVDDFSIWDSTSIINYLEDITVDDRTLFPGNENERANARLLQTYSNSIVGKDLREVIFEKRGKPESEWDIERIERGNNGWHEKLDWLEKKIESTGSFLTCGFSVADAALLPRFILAEMYGVGVSDNHPALFLWYTRNKDIVF